MKTTPTLMMLALLLAGCDQSPATDAAPQSAPESATLDVAKAFLTAAGSGDMATLRDLAAADLVWHNEGDQRVPWIGTWSGKETVFETFLPTFGQGLKATQWSTDYEFVAGDVAVFMGTMTATATNSGASTGPMSWAVRVEVENGSVTRWHWLEDSFAVSQAYQGDANDGTPSGGEDE